jgi:hypothetical protein
MYSMPPFTQKKANDMSNPTAKPAKQMTVQYCSMLYIDFYEPVPSPIT